MYHHSAASTDDIKIKSIQSILTEYFFIFANLVYPKAGITNDNSIIPTWCWLILSFIWKFKMKVKQICCQNITDLSALWKTSLLIWIIAFENWKDISSKSIWCQQWPNTFMFIVIIHIFAIISLKLEHKNSKSSPDF